MSVALYTTNYATYFHENTTYQVTAYTREVDLPGNTRLSETLSCLGEGRWCYLLNLEGALLLTDGTYNIPIIPENEVEYALSLSAISMRIEMTDRLLFRALTPEEKFSVLGQALTRGSQPIPETFRPPAAEPMDEPMETGEDEVEPLADLVDAESESPLRSSQVEEVEENEEEPGYCRGRREKLTHGVCLDSH